MRSARDGSLLLADRGRPDPSYWALDGMLPSDPGLPMLALKFCMAWN